MRTWRLTPTPRSWQTEALERWRQKFAGIASVVTGAGKTVFAEMCLLEVAAQWPSARFLVVVPTLALLDQWYVSLTEELGVSSSEIATYSGLGRPIQPGRVNILVLNTARTLTETISTGGPACLIVDECHRAGSPVNAGALRGSYIATLGLSATPTREYDEGFHEYLVPRLGPIIYEYDYDRARREGIVAPFELINVQVPLFEDEATTYHKMTRRIAQVFRFVNSGRADSEQLKRLLQRRSAFIANTRMRIPVAAKIVEQHRNDRSIVFHERIESANAIAQLLNTRSISTALYHTKIGESIRRDNLRLYRRGLFDCLVTCRALDEGINIPETRIAVVAASTRSTRQRIQRLGRVLRPAAGKTAATVYTLYSTRPEQNQLLKESDRLGDVVQVQWIKGGLEGGEQDSGR
jgi:superfamily II DNA or RNA helicase